MRRRSTSSGWSRSSAGRAASGCSSGSRWVWTSCDVGLLAERRLDALGDVVRLSDRDVARHLQMQGHADLAVVLVDRDVVRLAHQRLGERDREHAVAEVEPLAAWLEMDHHVGLGQRVADCGLDGIGGVVALDDGLPGRHADDSIGEVAPAGLA